MHYNFFTFFRISSHYNTLLRSNYFRISKTFSFFSLKSVRIKEKISDGWCWRWTSHLERTFSLAFLKKSLVFWQLQLFRNKQIALFALSEIVTDAIFPQFHHLPLHHFPSISSLCLLHSFKLSNSYVQCRCL